MVMSYHVYALRDSSNIGLRIRKIGDCYAQNDRNLSDQSPAARATSSLRMANNKKGGLPPPFVLIGYATTQLSACRSSRRRRRPSARAWSLCPRATCRYRSLCPSIARDGLHVL